MPGCAHWKEQHPWMPGCAHPKNPRPWMPTFINLIDNYFGNQGERGHAWNSDWIEWIKYQCSGAIVSLHLWQPRAGIQKYATPWMPETVLNTLDAREYTTLSMWHDNRNVVFKTCFLVFNFTCLWFDGGLGHTCQDRIAVPPNLGTSWCSLLWSHHFWCIN